MFGLKYIGLLVVLLSGGFFAPDSVCAQNISIRAAVNKTKMGVGDQAVLTLTVKSSSRSVPTPKIPKIKGFSVYASGNSSQFSMNGRSISASKVYNYTLVPTGTGTFTIPAISVSMKGKAASSAPLKIQVVQGKVQAQKRGGRIPAGKKPAKGKYTVFVKARANRTTAYVNQQIILTYELYSNVNLNGASFKKMPQMTGFWAEDIEIPRGKNQKIVTIDGQRFLRVILKKTALFPLSSGKHTIEPGEVQVEINDPNADPFGFGFFNFSRRSSGFSLPRTYCRPTWWER